MDNEKLHFYIFKCLEDHTEDAVYPYNEILLDLTINEASQLFRDPGLVDLLISIICRLKREEYNIAILKEGEYIG